MKCQHLLPSLVCATILSACATTGKVETAPKPAPTIAAAMAEVDAAVLAGQNDKAYTILKTATTAFPTDKTPWVRMAQMRFDSTDYGEAIVNALEALQRDPDDNLANSIVAVSGLRVTSRALADLSQKNNLAGNVRTEAQELAKLLRTSLGEDALINGKSAGKPVKEPARAAVRAIAAPSTPRPVSNDPFGALK